MDLSTRRRYLVVHDRGRHGSLQVLENVHLVLHLVLAHHTLVLGLLEKYIHKLLLDLLQLLVSLCAKLLLLLKKLVQLDYLVAQALVFLLQDLFVGLESLELALALLAESLRTHSVLEQPT